MARNQRHCRGSTSSQSSKTPQDIKRYICLNLLKQVPLFHGMDDRLQDALCASLKTVLYTENSYIVGEGEPVEDMWFIMRGNLISSTTYGGRTGFFISVILEAGDICEEELINWALDPRSSYFPISYRTVRALTEVEGFLLSANDLKFVATQFPQLQSKEFRRLSRQDFQLIQCRLD